MPPELLPPGDSGNMYDTEQYHREYNETGKLKRNLQRYHPKGFSLSKPLPLSGILCFGTYCNFSTRAKVYMTRHVLLLHIERRNWFLFALLDISKLYFVEQVKLFLRIHLYLYITCKFFLCLLHILTHRTRL